MKFFKSTLKKIKAQNSLASKGQIEMTLHREMAPDRNSKMGGRSFYFFDFDDNVLYLSTPIIIFHKKNGKEKKLSSSEYAISRESIGIEGEYKNYELNYCPIEGSYRNFRDPQLHPVKKKLNSVIGKKVSFVEDISKAIKGPDVYWKGPSWSCFYHAVFNERPISVITARGHHPETVKEGIRLLVKKGHLPKEPNYLAIYPVNHESTCKRLGHTLSDDVADVKKSAIHDAVKKATEIYGEDAPHRFGMSDDDPKNLKLIREAMLELKSIYTKMSFFVISTTQGGFLKQEVFSKVKKGSPQYEQQMDLF